MRHAVRCVSIVCECGLFFFSFTLASWDFCVPPHQPDPLCIALSAKLSITIDSLFARAPTLSYTKQLEARVAQLEDALSKLRNQQPPESVSRKGASPASPGESSASPGIRTRIKEEDENEQELARDFEGLEVEHDGRISFHGPTSLFQLPSGLLNETSSTSRLAMQLEGRKERLINNAWRERAFEQMATMPVSIFRSNLQI